ncbi:MAG: Helix-turn-helix domain [Rhodocyclales bacterium]|nr:Helix-turn-helix domain [Rhodocyclales bacterium]
MELGDKLRALREVDGLTQEQAATKYGLSLSSYRKYEADSNEPGASALKGMADAGVDINALLAGHSVREPHTAYGAATPALRLNREALAAILEGLLKVMNDPKQIAEHLATVYEGAYNTGQITEGGIGSGDKADAA